MGEDAAHHGKRAVVAGAGPCGALAAILLAQQGYRVQVFDKRQRPERLPPRSDRRAYLLTLNPRALDAFRLAQVDVGPIIKAHNGAVEMKITKADGSVRLGFKSEVTPSNYTSLKVYRDEISRHLIDEAQRLFPEAISFAFEQPLTSVDFDKRTVELSPQGKMTQEVHYDLLVGADGAQSAVREELRKVLPPTFLSRRSHSIVYTTGLLEGAAAGEFPSHTFMQVQAFEGGTVMLYCRGDGDKRLGLFMDKRGADLIGAGDCSWLVKRMHKELPNLAQSVKSSVESLVRQKPEFQKMSGWTQVNQLHGPRTVLVGDAAHSMTPVLGQGCNAGLEDVALFTRMLKDCGGNIDSTLPAYTAARLPDVTALMEINEIAAQERVNVKGRGQDFLHRLFISSHSLLLGLHLRLHTVLHTIMPSIFDQPALLRAQMGALSFRWVRPAMYWDVAALTSLALGVATAGYALCKS